MQKFNIIKKIVGPKISYVHKNEEELIIKTITDSSYTTNGENIILVKNTDYCEITLDENTTTHLVVKSLTNTLLKTNGPLIDDYYVEIMTKKGSCVELMYIDSCWYVLSSDGLKFD